MVRAEGEEGGGGSCHPLGGRNGKLEWAERLSRAPGRSSLTCVLGGLCAPRCSLTADSETLGALRALLQHGAEQSKPSSSPGGSTLFEEVGNASLVQERVP